MPTDTEDDREIPPALKLIWIMIRAGRKREQSTSRNDSDDEDEDDEHKRKRSKTSNDGEGKEEEKDEASCESEISDGCLDERAERARRCDCRRLSGEPRRAERPASNE